MRVKPDAPLGFFSAAAQGVALAYAWERDAFPWLMTWEENFARTQAPWSSRTLCRGLEFGSYAMALGRKWNVEQGRIFDVPTFEWLDAYETKVTRFWIALTPCDGDPHDCALAGSALTLAGTKLQLN